MSPQRLREQQGTQLHGLLRKLSNLVENRDDLGSLIGYSVLDSLYSFSTNSGSEEEIKLQETKAIYENIDTAIDDVLERLQELGTENASYDLLCDKMKAVDGRMRTEPGDATRPSRSRLLAIIRETLPEKGYEDKIRRYGLKLLETVERRGRFIENKERTLLGDYEDIMTCFTSRGRHA